MIRAWLARLRGGTPAAEVGPPATAEAYRAQLDAVLPHHTAAAVARLRAVAEALPEKARRIDVGVHPTQDGDGRFDVMVHLDGPDLYVLSKAVQPHRRLLEMRPGDPRASGLPRFDGAEEEGRDWEVNDVIAEACGDWIETVWQAAGPMPRPGVAFADEGWGDLHRDLPGGPG